MTTISQSPSISQKLFAKPWPFIWISIFTLIIIIGLSSPDSHFLTSIKLGGIILCLIYTLLTFPNDNLLHFALFTTVIADIILAINNTAELGIILFFMAQIIHTFRLSRGKLDPRLIAFFIAIALGCTLITTIFHLAPPIYTISTFYVINLIINIIICWRWSANDSKNLRAKLGLYGFLLFLCCDTCTGISYLSFTDIFPSFLYLPANFFAWFFYYPSQVLISTSSKISASRNTTN